MRWLDAARARLQLLFGRGSAESRMDEEFRFHVDMAAEANERAGMSPEEARRCALVSFGGVERHKEQMRDERGARWLADAAQDVRHALRTLRRTPGFTWAAVVTLALGIGGTTAVFSLVEKVLLEPLPFREPNRLVAVGAGMGVLGEALALQDHVDAFEGLEAYTISLPRSLTGSGEPERLTTTSVTPGLFPLLGVAAEVGRGFRPEESRPGSSDVVVLSQGLWQRRFGGDPAVIGSRIQLEGEFRTVVGVMPAEFRFPGPRIDAWLPIVTVVPDRSVLWGSGGFRKVARLAPGASPAGAEAQVAAQGPRIRELLPWKMDGDYWQPTVVPLHDQMVGNARVLLLILFAAVTLLLLVACANVANLLLSRAAAREREVAVRASLGARRGRLVRQMLAESVVLGLVGGAVGVGLAVAAIAATRRLLPPTFPRSADVGIDVTVLAFAGSISLATSLAFGLVPALRATRWSPVTGLAFDGRGGVPGRRRRLSSAIVAAEIAVTVVLVIGAGLLLRSFSGLLDVDPGFRPQNVVVANVAPPQFRYPDPADRVEFYGRILERIRSLPDVTAAAVGEGVPFGGDAYGSVFLIDGRPDPSVTGDWPMADARVTVGPRYFEALGIPFLEGRPFTAEDRAGAPDVAIVSRALAARYWPGEEVVGKRLKLVWEDGWRTVVGVVGDVRWSSLGTDAGAALFVPLGQGPTGPMRVLARTSGGTSAVIRALPDLVASVDKDTPVSGLGTERALVSDSLARPRWAAALLTIFAALALALGAVGIYGVTSYAITQRTREYAIRIALGAPRGRVLWRLLRWGGGLAAAGIVVGLAGAALATRLLETMLFGIGPRDTVTFLTVPLFMAAVALAACWLPARRATRADPAASLRAE